MKIVKKVLFWFVALVAFLFTATVIYRIPHFIELERTKPIVFRDFTTRIPYVELGYSSIKEFLYYR